MDIEDIEIDEWALKLTQTKDILQQCQIDKNIDSCSKCDKLLDCNTRDEYIKAVYDSMNKGTGGGFEF